MSETTTTMLQAGDKVFVLHRPMVPGEPRRHFFGVVEDCDAMAARVTGRVFSVDSSSLNNQFASRDLPRTRIIPLGSAGVIVNILPASVNIDKISYNYDAGSGGRLHITDGSKWHLDINPSS